jgi:hypothetical protein
MTDYIREWEQEGIHAYFQGRELSDNPYDEGTEAYSAWQRGWLRAKSGGTQ